MLETAFQSASGKRVAVRPPSFEGMFSNRGRLRNLDDKNLLPDSPNFIVWLTRQHIDSSPRTAIPLESRFMVRFFLSLRPYFCAT